MNDAGGLTLIYRLVKTVFPEVHLCLAAWRGQASQIPEGVLRQQALSSIEKKKFHCQGGCVYALYPAALTGDAIRFIVAFQTISDYLDNLCDRAGVADEAAFRHLHLALSDAIELDVPLHDYYEFYPHKDDGGYLDGLVKACRREIGRLPSLEAVKDDMLQLISLYSELQVNKHLQYQAREEKLTLWATPLAAQYLGISAWEFCAAAGSTLGVFLLFAAAQRPGFTAGEEKILLDAYLPWVCGLHILLDYFIDAEEDRAEGDFNFTCFYRSMEECGERLSFFIGQSLLKCSKLQYSEFHKTVILGLLAMYLSDEKAGAGMNKRMSRRLVRCGGNKAMVYWNICRTMRMLGKL